MPPANPPTGVWLAERAQRAAAPVAGPDQPILRATLDDVLAPEYIGEAVTIWNRLMRGMMFSGPHRTALSILNGTMRHRSVPELPPFDPAHLAPLDGAPVWNARAWPVYPGGAIRSWRPGRMLAGFDVNAMYLSAAGIELPVDAPVLLSCPSNPAWLKHPGYVQVAALEGAPWSIGDRWEEDMWMPTPLAAYLVDAGAELLISHALVWHRHRRWLDPHADLLRRARADLLATPGPAAAAVLSLVKEIYTRAFGGLLRSEKYNSGATYQPVAGAMVPATGQARMFRALDKTLPLAPDGTPVRTGGDLAVVGIYADAAWFEMPAGYVVPPGLTISTQPGKFKFAGRVQWSEELHQAYANGETEPLRAALAA